MKTKVTNMFRGKERKKRTKNRYGKLNRGRWRRVIYVIYIKDLFIFMNKWINVGLCPNKGIIVEKI